MADLAVGHGDERTQLPRGVKKNRVRWHRKVNQLFFSFLFFIFCYLFLLVFFTFKDFVVDLFCQPLETSI